MNFLSNMREHVNLPNFITAHLPIVSNNKGISWCSNKSLSNFVSVFLKSWLILVDSNDVSDDLEISKILKLMKILSKTNV